MCHLQRIHLHFWRVDAVMQGAYHCWRYPHITKLCSTQQHFIIALVFLLVLTCCYSPSKAGQRKLILIQKMSFQTQEFAFAFWLVWWGFCSYFTTAWDGSRNLCLAAAPWFLCGHLSPYPCSYCICTCVIIIIYKVQNHVHRGCSKCTHTQSHTHRSILTTLDPVYMSVVAVSVSLAALEVVTKCWTKLWGYVIESQPTTTTTELVGV